MLGMSLVCSWGLVHLQVPVKLEGRSRKADSAQKTVKSVKETIEKNKVKAFSWPQRWQKADSLSYRPRADFGELVAT